MPAGLIDETARPCSEIWLSVAYHKFTNATGDPLAKTFIQPPGQAIIRYVAAKKKMAHFVSQGYLEVNGLAFIFE